jgi:hypothetical protein
MRAKGELFEDLRNLMPEHLEDEGKRESKGAEGGAWKEGAPNQSLRELRVEQGREEDGGRKSTLNYPYSECRVGNREI